MKLLKVSNIWVVIFLASLLYVKEINYIYFDSTQSADFGKYFSYFEYFFGINETSYREHGTFFYYLHSLNFSRYSLDISGENFYYLLNKSIQEINFSLYVVGVVGYYKLLSHFKFNKTQIFATLTVLNFLPMVIAMIITFKPEIMVFSFLPWILLCLEKFKKHSNITYLFIAIPVLAIIISSKGSAFGMVGLYLLITNISFVNKLKLKDIVFLILIFSSLVAIISVQDYKVNQANILQVEHEEKYKNNASIKILYNFDFVKTIKSPIKNNHSSSFISLTLLDTFGDYFDIYWNNDSSLFFKNRQDVLLVQESYNLLAPKINFTNKTITINAQRLTDIYLTSSIGIFLSIIFYIQIFKNLFSRNVYSTFILAPFIGIGLILIQSILGFPRQNWDPLVGDSIKPYYYGFFITLSFVFIVISFLKKYRFSYFLIPFFILCSLHILGFPKEGNFDYVNEISEVNSFSSQCVINKYLFKELKDFENSSCGNSTLTKRDVYVEYSYFKSSPKLKTVNTFLLIYLSFLFIIVNFKDRLIEIKNKKYKKII
jgi:hypothetical protein